MKKVTIYITNFNYERFIRQSIESVYAQSYPNIELLIIDDGSTDNSREIIEECRGHKETKIIFQQNKGLNATNNVAMNTASGEYLMRLDADDFIEVDAVEKMVAVLDADDEVGLVFPDYFYVNAHGLQTGREIRHDFESKVTLYDQPAHGAVTMIRLKFLKALGGYNESFTCQDGYDLWTKFITHHKVRNINEPLFSYRRHGNNLTTNEARILGTRMLIKDTFVEQFKYRLPKTFAMLPLRAKNIKGQDWNLMRRGNGKSVIETAIEKLSKAKNLGEIIVIYNEPAHGDHLNEIRDKYSNLHIIQRPDEYAELDSTLFKTLYLAQEYASANFNDTYEAVLTLSTDNPFIDTDEINDAVNTMAVFDSDSLISVRRNNKLYFQHRGDGLKPILDQEKFARFEREALYQWRGGIMLSRLKSLLETKTMIGGKVGHIEVTEKAAFGIDSAFDLEVFKALEA